MFRLINVCLLGCPRLLRIDLGTENCNLALIQPMLRYFHTDDLSRNACHRYGKSTTNQVYYVAMNPPWQYNA